MPASLLRSAGFGSLHTQSAYQSMSFVSNPLTPLSRPVSLGEGTATMQPPSLTTFSSAGLPPTGASGLPARATVTSTVEAMNPTARRIPTLPAGCCYKPRAVVKACWRGGEARHAGGARHEYTSRQKGGASVLKVEASRFGDFDLRHTPLTFLWHRSTLPSLWECRVVQEGRRQ